MATSELGLGTAFMTCRNKGKNRMFDRLAAVKCYAGASVLPGKAEALLGATRSAAEAHPTLYRILVDRNHEDDFPLSIRLYEIFQLSMVISFSFSLLRVFLMLIIENKRNITVQTDIIIRSRHDVIDTA